MPCVGSCGEKKSLRFESSAEFGVESSRTKGPLWVQQTWGPVHWLVPVSGYLGQMGVR